MVFVRSQPNDKATPRKKLIVISDSEDDIPIRKTIHNRKSATASTDSEYFDAVVDLQEFDSLAEEFEAVNLQPDFIRLPITPKTADKVLLDSEDDAENQSPRTNSWLSIPKLPKTPLQKRLIDSPLNSPFNQLHVQKSKLQNAVKKEFISERERIATKLLGEFVICLFNDAALDHPITIEWNKNLRKTAGRAEYNFTTKKAKIVLSTKILDTAAKLRQTLAHELCHVAVWVFDGNNKQPHGKEFRKYCTKIERAYHEDEVGLEDAIVISTRHSYEINYKFEYRCLNQECGKVYGRHSKSIDIGKKVCGICQSKLELLHSKPPNAFQKFMSENFAKVKAQLKFESQKSPVHAAVMSQLSKDYQKSKQAVNNL